MLRLLHFLYVFPSLLHLKNRRGGLITRAPDLLRVPAALKFGITEHFSCMIVTDIFGEHSPQTVFERLGDDRRCAHATRLGRGRAKFIETPSFLGLSAFVFLAGRQEIIDDSIRDIASETATSGQVKPEMLSGKNSAEGCFFSRCRKALEGAHYSR